MNVQSSTLSYCMFNSIIFIFIFMEEKYISPALTEIVLCLEHGFAQSKGIGSRFEDPTTNDSLFDGIWDDIYDGGSK